MAQAMPDSPDLAIHNKNVVKECTKNWNKLTYLEGVKAGIEYLFKVIIMKY
jgi:hypothetical protein